MVTYTDFTSSFPLHDIFMIFFSEAPETGPHVFYMTCQDECELWWSPGDTPDNRKRIILVPFGVILDVKANEWEK